MDTKTKNNYQQTRIFTVSSISAISWRFDANITIAQQARFFKDILTSKKHAIFRFSNRVGCSLLLLTALVSCKNYALNTQRRRMDTQLKLEEQFFFHLVFIFSSQGKFRVVGGCGFHVTDHKNDDQLSEIYCRFDSPQTWLKKISWCRFKLKPRAKLCTLPFFQMCNNNKLTVFPHVADSTAGKFKRSQLNAAFRLIKQCTLFNAFWNTRFVYWLFRTRLPALSGLFRMV